MKPIKQPINTNNNYTNNTFIQVKHWYVNDTSMKTDVYCEFENPVTLNINSIASMAYFCAKQYHSGKAVNKEPLYKITSAHGKNVYVAESTYKKILELLDVHILF